MGMDTGGNRMAVRSDINITPLVDVVLVLLIIFMVITPMLQRGHAVELPKAITAVSGPPNQDPKFISVDREGKVYLEKELVTLDALKDQLFVINQQGIHVMLKADRETEYKYIRLVLDKASKAKLTKLALAAEVQKVQ